ncbi:hypothetical protein [Nocardia sp. NPDC058497]|uniref:hypothetical protein n=1 Tax=Nocardia sp. NPDC058497 TaxID=3346529 RepID=UPI003663CE39
MSQRDSRRQFWAGISWQAVSALAASAAAVAVAVAVIPEFWIGGRLPEQAWLVGGIAAALTAVGAFPALAYRRLHRALGRAVQSTGSADPGADTSDWDFFAPFLRFTLLMFIVLLVNLAIVWATTSAALWLSTRLGHACGLPVRLVGFWPIALAGLVTSAVCSVSGVMLGLLRGNRRVLRGARVLAEYGLVLGGLWLAVTTLDGVALDAGTGMAQLFTLIALACLFSKMDFQISVPFLTTLLMITINALKLWLLSWISTGMQTPLRITGFSNFVWTALIITLATVSARLIARAQEPLSPALPQNQFPHDPFADQPPGPPFGWVY